MKHRWLIFRFVLLTLMEWKPLVKMKLLVDLSLGIKAWDTLFYLLRESDAGASNLDSGGVEVCMIRNVFEAYWGAFPHVCMGIGWIVLKLGSFYLIPGTVFSGFRRMLAGGVTNYP